MRREIILSVMCCCLLLSPVLLFSCLIFIKRWIINELTGNSSENDVIINLWKINVKILWRRYKIDVMSWRCVLALMWRCRYGQLRSLLDCRGGLWRLFWKKLANGGWLLSFLSWRCCCSLSISLVRRRRGMSWWWLGRKSDLFRFDRWYYEMKVYNWNVEKGVVFDKGI